MKDAYFTRVNMGETWRNVSKETINESNYLFTFWTV